VTMRVVLDEAARDIDQILDFLERKAGARTAVKYGRLLGRQLALLDEFPGLGTPRPELGQLARIAVVSPYVIIYDFDPSRDEVVVLRIVHGRRNITRELLPSTRDDDRSQERD